MDKNKAKKIIPAVLLLAIVGVLIKVFVLKPEFRYAGTVEATKVDLPSRLPSVIAAVSAQEGQKVTAGQTLVSLDCEDLKIGAELANANYDRALKLFKSGSMPQEAYDQTRTRKRDSDLKLQWCEIKSPITGRVLTRYREPGEWVTQGTRLLTLARLEDAWAYIYVPQKSIPKLTLGMEIEAFIPEMEMRKIPAKIIKINDEAEFTPKNVQTQEERTRLVYGVKLGFENKDELLKPGMTIEAKLPLAE